MNQLLFLSLSLDRFLEGTNCVGMCTNLCKMPSQTFIKQSLGMPINMVPSKHFTSANFSNFFFPLSG